MPDDRETPTTIDDRASRWRADLASWAIPDRILDQAPQTPWIHPVSMFTVADDDVLDSPSARIARAALPADGSVLDVGSGGGRAAMALVPPAGTLMAVDHQQGMLDAFGDAAARRGVRSALYLGDWPAIANMVPECDVVVCHHVVFNVPDIVPFLQALDRHARARVVIEMPVHHPLTHLNPLWKQFWDLDRPSRPTSDDLLALARAMGFDAHSQEWEDQTWGQRVALPDAERVRFARIRLCLADDRDAEVAAALIASADQAPRAVSTIWWDVQR